MRHATREDGVMVRVWVVLLSLLAAGGSFIYKMSFRSPATDQISLAVALVTAELPDRAASKADRLEIHPVTDVAAKAVEHIVPITAPMEVAEVKKPPPPEKPRKIISRHWRASYARMTPRTVRQPPPVEQAAKPDDMRSRVLSWLKIGG
jgi:hypothetical protein